MRIDGGTKASSGQQSESRFEQVMSRELSRASSSKTPAETNSRINLAATSKKQAPGSERVGVSFKDSQAGKVLKGMQDGAKNAFTKAMTLTIQASKTAIATLGKTVDSMMSKTETAKDGPAGRAFGKDGATGKAMGDASGRPGAGQETGTTKKPGEASSARSPTIAAGPKEGSANSTTPTSQKSKTVGTASEKTGETSTTEKSGKDGATGKTIGDASGKSGAGQGAEGGKQSGETPSSRAGTGSQSGTAGTAAQTGETSTTKTSGKDGATGKTIGDASGKSGAGQGAEGDGKSARSGTAGTGSPGTPASTPEGKAELQNATRNVLSKAMPLTARTAMATFGQNMNSLMSKAQMTFKSGAMAGALGKEGAAGDAAGKSSASQGAGTAAQNGEAGPARGPATGSGPQNSSAQSSSSSSTAGAPAQATLSRGDGPALAPGAERSAGVAAPLLSDAGALTTTTATGTPTEAVGAQEGRAALALQDTPMTQEGFLLLSPGLQGIARRAKENGSTLSMVYMLGPNPHGAEFVSITTDDNGFITGPNIDIALTEGTVDTEGNWVAQAGKGTLGDAKVVLEPDADGCAFVTDGVDGVPSSVTAWVKDGDVIRADVMTVRKIE